MSLEMFWICLGKLLIAIVCIWIRHRAFDVEIHHCVHTLSHVQMLLGDSHACSCAPSQNLPTAFRAGTRPAMRNARCAIH